MAFDQETRNRLARFVSQGRALLTEEFARQLQHEYGLDPTTGMVAPIEQLTALDDARRETSHILRETMTYYLDGSQGDKKSRQVALDRILREQAFTVLNRLCSLRMAEARGIILPAVGHGYRSKGFQLYAMLAGSALGETGEAYQAFLFSLFDELAGELPPLFDRFSPEGRLFPRPTALLDLLELINTPDLEPLWAQDETIGWIYQYFNSSEERRAMRAASQAPRNSRELAVRNQFFTPRYVVEFLTDNTLGRIWYEMTKGQTGLADSCRYLVRRPNEVFLANGEKAPELGMPAEDLSQEELLRQPVYIPHHPLKDPREIRMLDPACGSMHFGLYAFDLFEHIYDEAWDLEERLGLAALQRGADLQSLHETYPDKAAFLQDVPRLIIERNVHGIDIDARAVQISGLSLWLRAQKSWAAMDLPRGRRPQICKSNVVCAEPMPGDRRMLEEFLAALDEAHLERLLRQVLQLSAARRLRVTKAMATALADLVRAVWREMELAGEAGSLLKIEETLREAVEAARKASKEKSPLFQVLDYDLGKGGPDFWDHAEHLVLAALQDYAERAANGSAYRRRLFAGDAAQGFAFIELCRRTYDVVLMNPPFGEEGKNSKRYIEQNYVNSKGNLLANFVERQLELINPAGLIGAITSRSCYFLGSFENYRKNLLAEQAQFHCFADFGDGVLEAVVETAAYCLGKIRDSTSHLPFFRLLVESEKSNGLLRAVQDFHQGIGNDQVFISNTAWFAKLPSSPFTYWISPEVIDQIVKYPAIEPAGCHLAVGLQTGQDWRFLRLSWEVAPEAIGIASPTGAESTDFSSIQEQYRDIFADTEVKWAYYSKTDEAIPWYSPIHLLVKWEKNGDEIRSFVDGNGRPRSAVRNESFYFLPGLSYMLRSTRLVPYVVPAGIIPTAGRSTAFPNSGLESNTLLLLSSNLGSAVTRFFGEKFAWPKFQKGMVQQIPFKAFSSSLVASGKRQITQEIHSRRKSYAHIEPFIDFVRLDYPSQDVEPASDDLTSLLGADLDERIAGEFGITLDGYRQLERDILEAVSLRALPDGEASNSGGLQTRDNAEPLVSYLAGLAYGRWDVRYATGERLPPDLPDPFAPLPACPPGMLQNAQSLPAGPEDIPAEYPLPITWGGVLVDDPGHPEDVVGRVREAMQVIWGERAEAIEAEACGILGVDSLRTYFRNHNLFFDDHLKRYSKSRRYAPIYWPLSTAAGSYTLWLYYHRLSDQTIYTCVNDFVDPKLKQVAEDLSRLRLKRSRTREDESQLERLTDLEQEIKDFREELLRVAAFWKPNLNDGVQITAAPLWKLFRHRQWQSRLKDTWQELEAGEYDWAHLAYSIWPKRVREKCKTDKSLAIAHNLKKLYVEPSQKKKGVAGSEKGRLGGDDL